MSGLANGIARKFEQKLAQMVDAVGRETVTPTSFRMFVSGLRGVLAAIGCRRGRRQLRSRTPQTSEGQETSTAVGDHAPLSPKGDMLVVSFDCVMTPMREDAEVAWREASVATISIYGQGTEAPKKPDTRFLARMPESGRKTLREQIANQVARAKWDRVFRRFAIFGEGDRASRWHEKLCGKLQLDELAELAVDYAIRTMRRCRELADAGSKNRKVVGYAIKHFRYHRSRMRYPAFLAMGLPNGSGPVEATAIAQARLKRSGMRWSRDGGQHVLNLRCFLKSGR